MRTKLQALQHIREEFKAGRLGAMNLTGSCLYRDRRGKHCSVGCLFTEAQLDDIRDRDLNRSGIGSLVRAIGPKNIKAVTRMQIFELRRMQNEHDNAYQQNNPGRFGKWLEAQIKSETRKTNSTK